MTNNLPKFHSLKCWPSPFRATLLGMKTAEYRYNDRDFRKGDVLVLQEWDPFEAAKPGTSGYTGRTLLMRVTDIRGLAPERAWFGIPDGYVVMSVKPISQDAARRLEAKGTRP